MTTVVQFSGGIDSLAALWLRRSEPAVCALWVKTDGAYPETQTWIEKVCAGAGVPLYIEYTQRHLSEYGFPADLVPLDVTPLGRFIRRTQQSTVVQSYLECCARSIWRPMQARTRTLGATKIVRGVKSCDTRLVDLRPGSVIDGIEYDFPIFDWTPEQVRAFVERECPQHIPPYYATEGTSRDCWDCTAYLDENVQRIANLNREQQRVVHARLHFLAVEALASFELICQASAASDFSPKDEEIRQ
jgi:3'-phosphoadenosine 5'-phosphosulfate sulfotransferase (PAPS reductase)/FAD synthetase